MASPSGHPLPLEIEWTRKLLLSSLVQPPREHMYLMVFWTMANSVRRPSEKKSIVYNLYGVSQIILIILSL